MHTEVIHKFVWETYTIGRQLKYNEFEFGAQSAFWEDRQYCSLLGVKNFNTYKIYY